jgi:hypothetical protein
MQIQKLVWQLVQLVIMVTQLLSLACFVSRHVLHVSIIIILVPNAKILVLLSIIYSKILA